MKTNELGRLWRTVRHLRFVQIIARLQLNFQRPTIDVSKRPKRRKSLGPWVTPATREIVLLGPSRFKLLNREENLSEIGWDNPEIPKLWRYNQHYFNDLVADGSPSRERWQKDLIHKWIEEVPLGRGTGWEPYPTSVRIVNWIKWSMSGAVLSENALQSLVIQVRWLSKKLEWHLLGNHLFMNAKSLVFAGLYFDGLEAEKWLKLGLRIIRNQLDEQFLSDGGQFELSTMYHSLAVEDLLDLINIIRSKPMREAEKILPLLQEKTEAGLSWLSVMCHPDGEIAFFNDAAFGVAPNPKELFHYADRLGLSASPQLEVMNYLESSGYVRLVSNSAHLFVDLARVGPDYLPGHAHADSLSFEFSLECARIFVNSGTSEYGDSHERLRQRGTAAHNCVVIGDQNSSEVWGAFRVGRRASIIRKKVWRDGHTLNAEGIHDGYVHLKGGGRHLRRYSLCPGRLVIEDWSEGTLRAEAWFHIHPHIEIRRIDRDSALLKLPTGGEIRLVTTGGPFRIFEGSWHPEFGMKCPSTVLVIPLMNGKSSLELFWG